MQITYDYKVDAELDIEVIGIPEGKRPIVCLSDGEMFTELAGCKIMVMDEELVREGVYPRHASVQTGEVETIGHFTEDRHE